MTSKRNKAVVLKYEPKLHQAPQIVGKGVGVVADKILDLAEANDVPILEDNNLMQSLYPLMVGEMIPEILYQPVAKILSFIMNYHQNEGSQVSQH